MAQTPKKTVRAYIGLGSNVGDSQQTLQNAVRALDALPGARVRKVSRLYRTKPVGVRDQPDFLNAVVALDVPAGPDPDTGALALLAALKNIEQVQFEFNQSARQLPVAIQMVNGQSRLDIYPNAKLVAYFPSNQLWLDVGPRAYDLSPTDDQMASENEMALIPIESFHLEYAGQSWTDPHQAESVAYSGVSLRFDVMQENRNGLSVAGAWASLDHAAVPSLLNTFQIPVTRIDNVTAGASNPQDMVIA